MKDDTNVSEHLSPQTKQEIAGFEAQHQAVQAQIEAMPAEQRDKIRETQKEVNKAIDASNEEFMSDAMFRADAMLKQFGLSGTDRDEFSAIIHRTIPGNAFVFRGKAFYRAHNKTVLLAINYIRSLETTVTKQYEELQTLAPSEGIISKIKKVVKRKPRSKKNG